MILRPSIVIARTVVLAVSACGTPRARRVPGTDMVYPHNRLDPLVASLIPTCLNTAPDRAGRTDVEMRHCTAIRADSVRDPSALGQPKTTWP
jgi:hypothetical protein